MQVLRTPFFLVPHALEFDFSACLVARLYFYVQNVIFDTSLSRSRIKRLSLYFHLLVGTPEEIL